MMKKMMVEETRKGPWTEQEDVQLAYFVRILGERRWDFVAKVSGLKRTGKSCRLRWVNYLHPGLKRGRMTPEEERLVLDLHSIWGNRWSRIARKLPGRTDNEIKNYWRTHMRKKAQERKRALSSSSSSSSICSTSASDPMQDDSSQDPKTEEASMKEKGSREEIREVEVVRGYSMDQIWNEIASTEEAEREEKGSLKPSISNELASLVSTNKTTKDEGSFQDKGDYSMDQIWEEIASPDEVTSGQGHETCQEKVCSFNSTSPVMVCPDLWDYYSDSLWSLNEREIRMLTPINDPVVSYFGHG